MKETEKNILNKHNEGFKMFLKEKIVLEFLKTLEEKFFVFLFLFCQKKILKILKISKKSKKFFLFFDLKIKQKLNKNKKINQHKFYFITSQQVTFNTNDKRKLLSKFNKEPNG